MADVCSMVHRALTWTDDRVTQGVPEHWQSHAEQILNIRNYRALDDCDGYALTAAELLIHKGFDPVDIDLILLEVDRSQGGGYHLVCGIDIEDTQWIIDNNFRKPKKLRLVGYYDRIQSMNLSDRGNWENR
jgi:predicted transglutaminase-like cysteine proteinase